jgi:hypothetical protein
MEVLTGIAQRIVGWIPTEFAYRLVASLMAMTVVFVLADKETSRPSDVIQGAARWVGLDLTNDIDAWAKWVSAPQRAGVITEVAGLLVVIGLVYVAIWAMQRRNVWSGAACLTFIAFALYLEARGGDRFVLSWAVAIVAIIAWSVWCLLQEDDDAPLIALSDLFVTAVWLPLLLLACAVSLPRAASRPGD